MSHTFYQTEAIIVGFSNVGESNRSIILFTESMGLIFARAQGVRGMESKLRYCLQGHSIISVQLIRGRELWRLINAEEITSFPSIKNEKEKRIILWRIFLLIKQYIVGEGEHMHIYNDIKKSLYFLENETYNKILANFEIAIVLRIMYRLGYIKKENSISSILDFEDWKKEILIKTESNKKEIVRAINKSFIESGL